MKRLLIGMLIGLGIANVAVIGAWTFREALQEAGVLPALDMPGRVQLPERRLPPIGATTAAEQVDGALHPADGQPGDSAPTPPGPDEAGPAPSLDQPAAAQPPASVSPPPPDDATLGDPAADREAPATTAEGDLREPDARASVASAALTRPPAEQAKCVVAGAFATRELAAQARSRLAARSADARVLVDSVAADPHYLVYVVPTGSRAEAEDTGRALRAQGVDSYVIPSGERAGGVSVGLFKSEQRAKAQRAHVAALGHDARVTVRSRERLVYRVRATEVALAAVADLPQQPCKEAATPLAESVPAP